MNEHAITVVDDKPQELHRRATDVAGVCKGIVLKTAVSIQGRKYVRVEGWQSIATAHGCIASSKDVERVVGGFRAVGEVRRMADGALLAQAEGFVGEDEPTWFGGGPKNLPKRAEYAIRAMCQTRAISRACRSAFAHVVVLMDAGLSTTPAEEVPEGGFDEHHEPAPQPKATRPTQVPAERVKAAESIDGILEAAPVTLTDYRESKSKDGAPKPWVAWFCTFTDGGNNLEAGTFDKKIGEKLDVLKGREVILKYKPSKSKPGKFEVVSIDPFENAN